MLYGPTTRNDLWLQSRRRVRTALGRLVAWATEWWRVRAATHRLSRLDDRLLADLGLRRDEIAERVRGRR